MRVVFVYIIDTYGMNVVRELLDFLSQLSFVRCDQFSLCVLFHFVYRVGSPLLHLAYVGVPYGFHGQCDQVDIDDVCQRGVASLFLHA